MDLSGSYGSVSFNPQRSDSQKTKMDTWVVMPYVNWQHDSGAYVDTVVSYGTFKGTVTTAARGRTATLQGTRMAASVEVGRPFALPIKSLTIEPQAQLSYQQMKFDRTRDVDGFAAEVEHLVTVEQVTVRAGAELAKQFTTGNGSDVKLYGTFNTVHGLDSSGKTYMGTDFGYGSAGTHVEVGLGGQLACWLEHYLWLGKLARALDPWRHQQHQLRCWRQHQILKHF